MAMQNDKYKTAYSLDPGAEGKQNPSFVGLAMDTFFEDKLDAEPKTLHM